MENQNFLHRLHRSNRDKFIGGVCGGLGETTPLPAWIWRIIFVSFAVYGGLGLLLYILFWIFMPKSQEDEQVAKHQENIMRRFARSQTDKKIAGICGGLGELSPVPSWIWRIGFICLTFIGLSGLIIYILIWIFAPAQKIQPQPYYS